MENQTARQTVTDGVYEYEVVDEDKEQQRKQAAAEYDAEIFKGIGAIDAFLAKSCSRQYEPIPTGLAKLDEALYGGFARQTLITLGAAPGAGKTALAQWIFDGMAARGVDCIYLNLEMSYEQLIARALSRITARHGAAAGKGYPPAMIMQGYARTADQRQEIAAAAEEYKTTIAPHMLLNPAVTTSGDPAQLDFIMFYLESMAKKAIAAGRPAPVAVIDYLQLVSVPHARDAAETIKTAIMQLKEWAKKYNTLALAIIAHNRSSNATGEVSMESGRDTSAIEYTADVQLALTYTACLKDGKKPNELEADEKQYVSLIVTKARSGKAGTVIDLRFDAESMSYTPDDHYDRLLAARKASRRTDELAEIDAAYDRYADSEQPITVDLIRQGMTGVKKKPSINMLKLKLERSGKYKVNGDVVTRLTPDQQVLSFDSVIGSDGGGIEVIDII